MSDMIEMRNALEAAALELIGYIRGNPKDSAEAVRDVNAAREFSRSIEKALEHRIYEHVFTSWHSPPPPGR